MVTFPPEAGLAMPFAGATPGAATGAADPELPVNVSATISVVLKVCSSPLISKRNTACVPPRYFPFKTRPSFNSKVSAAAAPTRNSPIANTDKKRFTLFIVPSHDRKSQFLEISASVPRAQGQLYHSTALDGGDVANGCAKCHRGKSQREEGIERRAQVEMAW